MELILTLVISELLTGRSFPFIIFVLMDSYSSYARHESRSFRKSLNTIDQDKKTRKDFTRDVPLMARGIQGLQGKKRKGTVAHPFYSK